MVIETKSVLASVGAGTGQDNHWEEAWENILGLGKLLYLSQDVNYMSAHIHHNGLNSIFNICSFHCL